MDSLHNFGQSAQRRLDAIELASAVIGNGNCGGAGVYGAAGIVSGENAFDYDGTAPRFANPRQIAPGHSGFGEGGGDTNKRHWPSAGNDDVGEKWDASIA